MEPIHQVIRSNYAVLAEAIQTEIQFLIDLAELTEDQRFKQSIAEVIYSLSDLFDTIDLQRRYLRSGMCNFSEPPTLYLKNSNRTTNEVQHCDSVVL